MRLSKPFALNPATAARNPLTLAAWAILWIMLVGNFPLWKALFDPPEMAGFSGLLSASGLMLVMGLIQFAVLSLLAWPRLVKPLIAVLLVSTAASSYYMLAFGVVIDAGMMTNVFATDASEAGDLLTWPFVWVLLGIAGIPLLWLLRQRVAVHTWPRQGGRNLATAGGAMVLALGLLLLQFQDIASLMRNHKSLRYQINPANVVAATTKLIAATLPQTQQTRQAIAEDVHQIRRAGADSAQAPLVVLVVGETARAANASLGGYARNTQPELSALIRAGEPLFYREALACGTSTAVSVPCMFSHLDSATWRNSDTPYENLLDVLKRAGVAVLWVDNQSGCKGVCERVESVSTRAASPACPAGDCLDSVMLTGLETRIAALDTARQQKGTLVVLHQMGSHGPAYFKRSAPARKLFQPECNNPALSECSQAEIVNAYDNSIRETDHFLAQTLAWLKAQKRPSVLIYASDHGESLGEYKLYLHGMPYALAPEEQKRVPMLLWRSPELNAAGSKAAGKVCAPSAGILTHDHLFHTVLGIFGLQTRAYQARLDAFAHCAAKLLAQEPSTSVGRSG